MHDRFEMKAGLDSTFMASAMRRAVGKVFKGKNIEKGVAFPTCVSVNKCGLC